MTQVEFRTMLARIECDGRHVPEHTPEVDPTRWLRLVHRVAKQHVFHNEADYDDAVQEGCARLIRASRLWKGRHESKAKFSTYAWPAIRRAIVRWQYHERRAHTRVLKGTRGRYFRRTRLLFSDVSPVFWFGDNRAFARDYSGDQRREEDMEYYRVRVAGAMRYLNNRDRTIIMARFGFGIEKAMTLDEIAAQLGLTRERVRQIELAILTRLRHLVTVDD